MWLLRNESKGLVYRITPGKQHIVTRKDGDLILIGDQSISRKHAVLYVDDDNDTNGIVVKDLGSKYGTFTVIGGGELVQVPSNNQATIGSGDCVRFGIQWNCWRADFVQLLVAVSALSQDEKSEVKEMVESLGGRLVSDWQDTCSHLTMNKLTVTIKVVCALASGQPIVTPSYWRSFIQSLSTMQAPLPDCKDYLPPLAEAMLNPTDVSFTPDPARRTLFQGYTFVAASAKQFGRIKSMITAAGGKAVEFSSKMWSDEKLSEEKTILMLSPVNERQGSEQSQVFDGYIPVARKLKSKGLRCIPESDIGLSVIYCSMSQYCNPRFSNKLISSPSSDQATQRLDAICPNTEVSMEVDQDNKDTVPGPHAQYSNRKRPLENQVENQEPLSKKPDLRENSEDLFDSQNANNTKTNIETSFKNTTSPAKPVKTILNPSLDMFAPSVDRSGPPIVRKQNVVAPPSEDLFASTRSRRQESKDTGSDEFSFPQSRNVKEPFGYVNNKDEFSFPNKSVKKSLTRKENIADEFSFKSNKTLITTSPNLDENEENLFSFSSIKRSNKRPRASNPDMFASSLETSVNNDLSPRQSKQIGSSRPNADQDNLFAFPDDHTQKRRKHNDEVLDFKSIGSEVKLPLLTHECDSEPGPSSIEIESKDSSEPKNLITYRKSNPCDPGKKEIGNEEIDELSNDMLNATIVIVKPLVVVKEKPLNTSEPVLNGKNFKKFRKVMGVNKRMIPHIIGGSDLVPHYKIAQNTDNNASSPLHVNLNDDDDEWTFNQNKINRRMF